MFHSQKGRKALFMILSCLILLAGCGKGEADQEKPDDKGTGTWLDEIQVADLKMGDEEVVAAYEGGKVTAKEFERYLHLMTFFSPQNAAISDPANWQGILENFVADRILEERAKAAGAQADEKRVDEVYQANKENVTQSLQGVAEYGDYLKKLQLSEEEVIDYIRMRFRIDQYLTSLATEEELRSLYEENKESYTLASVRHILIKTENRSDDEARKLAEELADRIRRGEDFAALAKQYSEDPGSKDNGGLYEDAAVANWVEEFKKAALELPLNEVSHPVKTEYGYHVIRVEKRRTLGFDEVREELKELEAYNKYMAFLMEELPGLIKETHLPETKKAE